MKKLLGKIFCFLGWHKPTPFEGEFLDALCVRCKRQGYYIFFNGYPFVRWTKN